MFRIRRLLAAMLIVALSVLCAVPALAAPEDYNKNMPQVLSGDLLYGEAAILIDGESGEVLLSKNAKTRMYPASTTKIMTLMLALESGIDMDTRIFIPEQAAQISADSSLVPVFPGDEMTFRDLLYGFMMRSGNDGANAVAVLVAGSLDAFVSRMNKKAKELGCTDTHFANAHGLHSEDHYTTAWDMAKITRAALEIDAFRKIVSTSSYTMSIWRNGSEVSNRVASTNSLLLKDSSYYYENCIGVKTGYHSAAGQCFVGAAEQDGVRLIVVDFHCEQSAQRWTDATRMFNFGFTKYTAYTLDQMFSMAAGRIATLKISNAARNDPYGGQLDLRIAQISDPNYARMVESGSSESMERAIEDFVSRSELVITDDMVAPVSEGEIMGQFRYLARSGENITALLIAGRSIAAQPPRARLTDIFPGLRVFNNPLVKLLGLVLLALLVLLIISGILRQNRKDRRRSRIYEARRQEYLRQTSLEQSRSRARNDARKGRKKRRKRDSSYDDDLFGNF